VFKHFISLLILFASFVTNGQYRFHNLNTDDGLSHNSVNHVFKDSKGYYWISTNDGLNLYNGSTFKHFRNDVKDKRSLSDNFVLQVSEDRNRTLWIATRHCLNWYSRQNKTFTNVNTKTIGGSYQGHNAIYKLVFDKNGNLFYQIGPNVYSIAKENLAKSIPYQDTLAKDRIFDFYIGEKNEFHYVCGKEYNIASTYKTIFDPKSKIQIPYTNSCIQQLVYANKNEALMIHCGKLYIINALTRNTEEIVLNLGELSASAFLMIGNNEFFIGSDQGLFKYNYKSKELRKIPFCDKNSKEEPVISISITSDSLLWVGTSGQGVFYTNIKRSRNRFLNSNVNDAIEIDKFNCTKEYKGRLFSGTGNGLIVSKKNLDSLQIHFKGLNICDIVTDPSNNIWLATTQGIWKCDENLKILKKFDTKSGVLKSDKIFDLHFSKVKNEIWAGTYCGLYKINCNTGIIQGYQQNEKLISGYVLDVEEDLEGNIWFTHSFGISKYINDTDTFENVTYVQNDSCGLSHRICSFFHADKRGFWVGTLGGGLNLKAYKKNCFQHFNTTKGLKSDMISGIATEDDTNWWIATYNGLAKISLNDTLIKNYSINNGLLCNEIGINGIRIEGGELYLCTPRGLNILSIQELLQPLSPKKPDIEAVYVNDLAINELDREIQLNTDNNHLVLQLHYPDLYDQKKLCYQYRLNNKNSQFQTLALGSSQLIFDNIGYGEHGIEIRMFDPISGNSSESIHLNVKNNLPFHRSKTFWSILILAFVVLISLSILTFQKRKHQTALRKLEMEQRLYKEKEMISKDLHDNIGSHLTYIIRHLDLVEQDLKDKNMSLERVNELGNIARDTVQQLRDTIWATHSNHVSLEEFWHRVKSYLLNYLATAHQMQVTSQLKGNGQINIHATILLQLFRILQEATQNIAKHSKATKVEVDFIQNNNQLEMIIKDNGIGFVEENENEKYGLKNMKERTELLKGNFELDSTLQSGTRIRICLPIEII